MINKFDDNMSAILETDNNIVPVNQNESLPILHKNVESDFDYSRENYYNLIEKGSEALNGIMQVAAESQSPRAYEVVSNMLKNMSEVTDKLMQLQLQKKQLEGKQQTATQVNVEKAVFVGSTADLLKKIKNESTN